MTRLTHSGLRGPSCISLGALLLLFSCTSSETGSCPGAGECQITGSGASQSQAFGPEGGSLSVGRVRLVIPPGALRETVAIRVTEEREATPAGYRALSPVYRFEPHGLEFLVPSRLEVRVSGGEEVGRTTLQWSRDRFVWEARSATVGSGGSASFEVSHFSFGFIGTPVLADGGTSTDGGVPGTVERLRVEPIENVDLLFMIDNSNSMAQEQNALSRELPNLVRALASGDIEGDGRQDFSPVRSLQVGVVTSDMGSGGFVVPTCSNARFGDDGVLRTRGNTARPGCSMTYPSFFEFNSADGGDVTRFADEVACVAAMGTNGCGFEQQLDSVLKAVTPSSSGIRFVEGSVGHADGQNGGFIRPSSLLAIILVTDEEDCSAANPGIFDPASTTFGGDLNLRCWTYGHPADGILHPVERFVDGLLATREDPGLLVVAAITGIPTATNPAVGEAIDYTGILAHPDMTELVDPSMPSRLRPSCDRTDEAGDRALAFPPRRIVSMLEQLEGRGASSTVQTICQDSFSSAIEAVVRKMADALHGTCLPRALARSAGNVVSCDVVEVLAVGRRCDELPGRTLVRMETDTFTGMNVEVCRVDQLPVVGDAIPVGEGWYYDDFSPDVVGADARCPEARPYRIAFTSPPSAGATVSLECAR